MPHNSQNNAPGADESLVDFRWSPKAGFRRWTPCAAVAAVGCWIAIQSVAAVDYTLDVTPILSAKCFECHGPDAGARKADLRLDDRPSAIGDRDGVKAIVPGHPELSELLARVTTDDEDDRMPPRQKGARLSPAEIDILREWIQDGAPYEEHWAFIPPSRPPLPAVDDIGWLGAAIDHFILSRLESAGLRPAQRASKETLIRRASLDLLGLPPSPREIEAFVNDTSSKAWERLIDRLLASPHYGERWGRHWLDVARYADSGGFETDIFFGHAWRYRDYVIHSFNTDKPFDQFIQEQVAGDELFPGDQEAWLATGLYTTGPVLQEAGMVKGKLEYDQLTDAVDTTGAAFLGLTVGCARCHDHKYDPLSQKEYFGLHALFAASDQFDFSEDGEKIRGRAALKKTQDEFELEQTRMRAMRETDTPQTSDNLRRVGRYYIQLDGDLERRVEQSELYGPLRKAIAQYHEAAASRGEAAQPALDEWLIAVGRRAMDMAERSDEARRAFRRLESDDEKNAFLLDYGERKLDTPPPEDFIEDIEQFQLEIGRQRLHDDSQIPIRVLAHRDEPWEVRLLERGELDRPGELIKPGFPSRLGMPPAEDEPPPDQRRAALAEWIASKENPLTARVIANRVWQWHFGTGLVRTPNDFGLRGERPAHPGLLDWLAVELMENNWRLKHLHRTIMLSSTYQMSSVPSQSTGPGDSASDGALDQDPDNRLLTRYQPRRLEAEVIWDSLRATAGTLNGDMFGLPFAPALDEQEMIGNFRTWPTSTPEESDRRAVYILTKRSFRFPPLSAFDLPDNIASCGRRDITTIPNQALALLNNRGVRDQAGAFARRLLRETDGAPDAVAKLAWRYAYGRPITEGELNRAVEFIQNRNKASALSEKPKETAVTELCLAIFNTNEFIYIP